MLATTPTCWFNFYKNVLDKYIAAYGNEFCLIVDHDEHANDAYILPYANFKYLFALERLKKSRWMGNIRDEYLRISNGGSPVEQIYVSEYHNAFALLQDAPQPVPPKPNIDRRV
jgi:hypothetical protein